MALKIHYKNRLPHIAPIGAAFFVTFRSWDSLPANIVDDLKSKMDTAIQKLKEEKPRGYKNQISKQSKLYFKRFEHQLDAEPYGHCYLKEPKIAKILKLKLHEFDSVLYDLISYCIMPNHVHALFDLSLQIVDEHNLLLNEIPDDYTQLHDIMKKLKGSTAYLANLYLKRRGKFWAKDSYDHYVRNEEELFNVIQYIILNPVKAGLVKDWKAYPHTYIKEGFEIG